MYIYNKFKGSVTFKLIVKDMSGDSSYSVEDSKYTYQTI